MSRGQNCTGCCGDCGRHFTSQSAFQQHRKDFRCVDPLERGLEIATRNGTCRIPPNQLDDVVIWRNPGSFDWTTLREAA